MKKENRVDHTGTTRYRPEARLTSVPMIEAVFDYSGFGG